MERRLVDPHHLEIFEDAAERLGVEGAAFDRAAFARRVLDVVMPDNWTVALYLREGGFHIQRVRDLRRGPDAVWAMVGISALASRAEIALRLAELTGRRDAPFLVDFLVSGPDGGQSVASRGI